MLLRVLLAPLAEEAHAGRVVGQTGRGDLPRLLEVATAGAESADTPHLGGERL